MKRQQAYALISAERGRQEDQWGGAKTDAGRTREEWIRYMQKQLNAAEWALTAPEWEDRLVKIAALAVAALEVTSPDEGGEGVSFVSVQGFAAELRDFAARIEQLAEDPQVAPLAFSGALCLGGADKLRASVLSYAWIDPIQPEAADALRAAGQACAQHSDDKASEIALLDSAASMRPN